MRQVRKGVAALIDFRLAESDVPVERLVRKSVASRSCRFARKGGVALLSRELASAKSGSAGGRALERGCGHAARGGSAAVVSRVKLSCRGSRKINSVRSIGRACLDGSAPEPMPMEWAWVLLTT